MQIGSLNPFLSSGSDSGKSKTCTELCRRIRNLKRFAFSVVLLTLSFSAEAQQPQKVPRIGLLSGLRPSPMPPSIEAFRKGLRELGYVEGQNIIVEYRWAEGKDDRYAPLAAELVSLGVDLIVTGGTQATVAAKQATSTIPIVVGGAGDLVGEGLVAGLSRPGGNVTGFTGINPDLSAKRLELLREALPKISRVAILYHGGPGGDQEELRETQTAAKKLGVQIQPLHVLESDQFQSAYAAMTKEHAQALIIFAGTFTTFHRTDLLERAAKIRIPTISGTPEWSEAGALISYGHDRRDQYRRAAVYVDKILKGTKPADLPIQQPMKFELVFNLKTAKQIGVTIPPTVLARADRVIK
jgi:putative tryptophan/tyrosine transport system substrate-binding protein